MSIGLNIKNYRRLNKLTQVELSQKAKISRSYLADLERDRYNPSIDTLSAIADALMITTTELLSNSGTTLQEIEKAPLTVEQAKEAYIQALIREGKLSKDKLYLEEDELKSLELKAAKLINN